MAVPCSAYDKKTLPKAIRFHIIIVRIRNANVPGWTVPISSIGGLATNSGQAIKVTMPLTPYATVSVYNKATGHFSDPHPQADIRRQ